MNDFRMPITGIPPTEGPEFGPSSFVDNQPGSGPQRPRLFLQLFGARTSSPGSVLGIEGPTVQVDSAQIVAYDDMPERHIPRLWNPALRCVPSPFGEASRPLFEPAVVQHLPIWRPTSPLRAAAGQATARPGAGGSGSAENVRIPSASTVQAF